MGNNLYTPSFGKSPAQHITRVVELNTIKETFNNTPPNQQAYIITGVRGSGKTVLMTDISKELAKDDSWIVVELNPERDLLIALASKLGNMSSLSKIFKSAKINVSILGVGVEIEINGAPVDIEVALQEMLAALDKKGKKVLVTIDEVSSNKNMRIFTSAFQIFIRQDLPLFLIMTGLYENVDALQNEKTLTFLHRAPKIYMKPLNYGAMSANYFKELPVDADEADKMAQMTKGFSFAFQALGFLVYEQKGLNDEVMVLYKQYLEEYVYNKIWSELSPKDREIATAIAESKTGKIADVREKLNMSNGDFSPYRDRLIKRGILDGSAYGVVSFVLPYFEEFVIRNKNY